MKRMAVVTTAVMGLVLVCGGCSQEKTKSQGTEQEMKQSGIQNPAQVKEDLATYLPAQEQAMKPWAKISPMSEELKKVKSAKEYIAKVNNEFVPLVSGVLAQMEAIKPATKEVQEIHAFYVSSIRDYYTGLQAMAEAVGKNDDAAVSAAAVKLNAFPLAHGKFLESINALSTRINVGSK